MKKLFCLFELIFLSLFSFGQIKIISVEANLRSSPEFKTNVICKIPQGTVISIVSDTVEYENWVKINFNGKVGFVHKDLIKDNERINATDQGSNVKYYTNTNGEKVQTPTYYKTIPIGATAESMSEPVQIVNLQSMVNEVFQNAPFTESAFPTQVVDPQRTFLEKICLLHEEFAKPLELIRAERMSRHFYDLVQMMHTTIADQSMTDLQLYDSVTEHRRVFIGLRDFDYSTLSRKTINIIQPVSVISQWKDDYKIMQETLIYGKSLPFDKLMEQITILNQRIRD